MASPTLRDVAERAGVHPSTASRALHPSKSAEVSEGTRMRVLAAAADLSYQVDMVARGLRQRRSDSIGIVVADLGNPFITPVIHGAAGAVEHRGFVCVVVETREDSDTLEKVLAHLTARRVDAIVSAAARVSHADIFRRWSERLPIVLAVRHIPGSGLPYVVSDDEGGVKMLVEHLAGLGHRVVAQLRGPSDIQTFLARSRAFVTAAETAGMAVIGLDASSRAPTVEEGARLMRVLLDQDGPRPTAVFAHNDLMAIGATSVLRERGLDCPADVSVAGYNDAPHTAYLDPPLTTVRLPAEAIGRRAADMALTLIDAPADDGAVRDVVIPPELVIRRSTAPPGVAVPR